MLTVRTKFTLQIKVIMGSRNRSAGLSVHYRTNVVLITCSQRRRGEQNYDSDWLFRFCVLHQLAKQRNNFNRGILSRRRRLRRRTLSGELFACACACLCVCILYLAATTNDDVRLPLGLIIKACLIKP